MKKQILLLLVIPMLLLTSCEKSYWGGFNDRFESFPENPVSPQQAKELAAPYLDRTFQLRSNMVSRSSDKKASVIVTLKGRYYHIVKDSYGSYSPGFYLHHAVKINKDTGEVIAPK